MNMESITRIDCRVFGDPVAQPRVKVTTRGGFARGYTPDRHGRLAEWKSAIFAAVLDQLPREPYPGPVSLTVRFYMPRPKSHFGTGKNAPVLKKTAPLRHTNKPDIDNLTKALMDALTISRVWKDDTQVIHLDIGKAYRALGKEPGAWIIVDSAAEVIEREEQP